MADAQRLRHPSVQRRGLQVLNTPPDQPSYFERAVQGDRDARDRLLRDNLPQLEAFLRLKAGAALRSKESLGDLAQSVCIQILQDLPKFEFRSEGQFRQWLFQHALHKLINKREYYDAKKRDMKREVAAAALADAAGERPSALSCYASFCTPSRHASAREQIERVERAFDELPDDYREAVNLRKVVGLDYQEIATAMGRSIPAVRNLVHRGVAKLSTLISE